MKAGEGRSLAETPTWAVATVITLLVAIGFFIHGGLKKFGNWLDRTKRKHLFAALEKIKEELIVFGLLSLLMGHWIILVAKICVKSSALSSRFYPCRSMNHLNNRSISRLLIDDTRAEFCPEDHQPFASYESLEQLHRFLFVLGVTHVSYSVPAIALSMIKIYSWRRWENHAKTLAFRGLLMGGISSAEIETSDGIRVRRLSSFVCNHTSHPWSRHDFLVWLLCFTRQFWSSINQADYMALRLGFITAHQLPFTYDFHNYMLRSMEEEFRDIVGISVPLWIFAIVCIILGFHGTNIYFWMSFLPTILILLMGTKLHRIVVKLAVEIMDSNQWKGVQQFNLRDELFWFGSPGLLLRVIQFVSFQNAFEMAMYLWSLWEIRGPSCYTGDRSFLAIRLTFGVLSQIWCSFITFPLYIIVTQMGSKYKRTIVSDNVRKSLHGWRKKVKTRHPIDLRTVASTTSLDSMLEDEHVEFEVNNDLMNLDEHTDEGRNNAVEFNNLSLEGSNEGDEMLSCDPEDVCSLPTGEIDANTA